MKAILIILFFYGGAQSQAVYMPTMAGCEAAKEKLLKDFQGKTQVACVENK